MITEPLSAIGLIVVAAMACQVAASRLKVPSVLFLLTVGVGLSTILDPDELFGELLFTGVGLGVAVLLFEGGTSLQWARLRTGRASVLRLVTVGALTAWVLGSAISVAVLDIDIELAILLGAILVVSGPTVVIPLLRVVRPRQPIAAILRWEGILIDPVGAGVAIVVLDAIIEERSAGRILLRVVTTFAAGAVIGGAASMVVLLALRAQLVADHLQIPATLALLIGSYAAANAIRPEAGLIAATILGMAFANQRLTPAAHIAEFNEHLGATVLGVLFIVLGARVDLSAIVDNLGPSLAIIAVLVLVARPLSVVASTIGTPITWAQRGFLMALAPRGVVAAAVASLFAIELAHHDIDPGPLVPVTFTVVIGTVLLTSLAARFAAVRLRVAEPEPNGVALIGGGPFALDLAAILGRYAIPSIHIALDEELEQEAAERGQLVYQGRLDSEDFASTITAVGVSAAVALSGTDHLDGFATERISRVIGSHQLYGIEVPELEPEPGTNQSVAVRSLLPSSLTAERLAELIAGGHRLFAAPGHQIRTDSLTIARIDEDHRIVFDPDPDNADPTDVLIQFGPSLPQTPYRLRSSP
ncbi:MAG: sodium:proton antiporter [Actinomycetota bacterium]